MKRRLGIRTAALAVLLFASSEVSAGEGQECAAAADRGQAARDKLQFRAARREFLACAKETCPVVVRTECIPWLADVDARLPTVVIRATDSTGRDLDDVRVSIDGVLEESRAFGRHIAVDPGLRHMRFEHAGVGPVERQIIAREGEHNRIIDVVFPAPSPGPAPPSTEKSRPFPVAAVVFTGIAVLGAGAFAFFAATGQSDVDDLRATCAPHCASSDVSSARTKIVIANVALGASIVSLGLAGYFFFAPTADRQGASASIGARF